MPSTLGSRSHGVKCLHQISLGNHRKSSQPPLSLLNDPLNTHKETSSQSLVDNHEYICPARLSILLSQVVINDNLNDVKSFYDCPLSNQSISNIITPPHRQHNDTVQEAPAPANESNISKEAKEIMRIRHKKMKKHKLRKLRKRMYFLWKKQKAARKAKRDAIYWKEISSIKQEAEDFDAETFVKQQLEKARRGGFYVKTFNPDSSNSQQGNV